VVEIIPRGENFSQTMHRIFEIGLIGGLSSSSLRIWRHRNSLLFHRPNHVVGPRRSSPGDFNSVFVRDARPPVAIPILVGGVVLVQWVHLRGLKEFAGRRIVQRHQHRALPDLSQLLALVTYLVAFYLTGRRRSATQWRQARGICAIGSGDVRSLLWVVPISDRLAANFHLRKTINLEMATGTYINYDHFAGLLK